MAPAAPGSPHADDDDPLYLSVIDLFAKVAFNYFAIVAIAVLIDLVRGDRLVFRAWSSFAVQSAAALLLATFVARRTLAGWQRAGRRFVPQSLSGAAAVTGIALAAGTLAGGLFPDALSYRPRAPEMFYRTLAALMPAAIAVYFVLRPAGRSLPVATTAQPPEPPLAGEARDAAIKALDLLDRGEQALTLFHQHAVSGQEITSADAKRLWAALDGPGYVAFLRQMPPNHAVTRALREAAVAQTDSAYLIFLAQGAHGVIGHTAESARDFLNEVASRRGRPGAEAEELKGLARTITKAERDAAAGLLHASRFSPPAASA